MMPAGAKPLVFSCLACRSIVADSTDYITALEQPQQLILVAGVTGTREDSAEQRATGDGVDNGSTYRAVVCEECGAAIGRRYTETQLEVLKGAFCLDVTQLRSYELGSAAQRLPIVSVGYAHDSEQPEQKPDVDRHREDMSQRLDELGTAYEELAADMLKVQHLLTVHDARINRLDGFQHDEAGPDPTEM